MNQTWEIGKNLIFDPILACSGPNLVPQNFFKGFASARCYCCKLSFYAISRKTNEPNWENARKPSFGSNFGPFGQNLGPKFLFSWILPLLEAGYYCKQSLYAISRKTKEPNLRKWQKTLVLGPILAYLT